jgi:hypothetical protein
MVQVILLSFKVTNYIKITNNNKINNSLLKTISFVKEDFPRIHIIIMKIVIIKIIFKSEKCNNNKQVKEALF